MASSVDRGRRAGLALFPPTQTTELRIQRHHVGQGGGARARQPVDVDRTQHRNLLDLGILAVPRLDLETVDQPSPKVGDHAGVRRGTQVAVAFQAVEKHVEAVAEVAGAEIREPAFLHGVGHQLVARGVSASHDVVLRTRSG